MRDPNRWTALFGVTPKTRKEEEEGRRQPLNLPGAPRPTRRGEHEEESIAPSTALNIDSIAESVADLSGQLADVSLSMHVAVLDAARLAAEVKTAQMRQKSDVWALRHMVLKDEGGPA